MSVMIKSCFAFIVLVTSINAFNYNSNWINKNPNTKSIKSISIRDGMIDVIGSCKSGGCSWGSVTYNSIPNGLVASWKYPRIGHKVLVIVATGTNELKVVSKYLYNGRQNTTTVLDYLRIQNTQSNTGLSATAQAPKNIQRAQAPTVVQAQQVEPKPIEQRMQAPQVKQVTTPTEVSTTQTSNTTIAGLPVNANLFMGRWLNDDTYTRGITRVQILGAKDSLIIQVWGRGGCYPDECHWGKHRLIPSGDGYITRWIQDGIDKSLKIEGIYIDENGVFKMLRAKTTNIVKGLPKPKYRTFYLKKIQ